MAFSHIQERKLAISRLPQTAIGTFFPTTTTPPLAYKALLVSDQNLTKFTPVTKDNDGFSTGSDFPTEVYLTSWDAQVDHTLQLEIDQIGRFLYAAMGAIATTTPVANVYQHVITPMAPFTGRQLPLYSYVEKIGNNALDQLFVGMGVERLTLRGTSTDRLEIEVSLRGTGKRISPSLVNFSGVSNHVTPATGLRYLLNSQASLKVRDYSTLANELNYSTGCRFRNWEITIENNLLADDGYCPGNPAFQTTGDTTSGQVRNELLFGKRNYTMQFVVRVDTASDEFAAIQTQKQLDILIEATGAQIVSGHNDRLAIHVPLAQYSAIDIGNENGIVTYQITPRILYDATADTVIEFVLKNGTASYLT